jgi:phosphoheptose isomerase
MGRQDVSENIRAVATEDGDVLLTIVDSKKRVRITLPIEAAQKLEAQIMAVLVTARIRLRKLGG